MSVINKSPLLEASESLRDYREEYNRKQQKKLSESAKVKAAIEEQLYFGKKQEREDRRRIISEYTENLKNELLGDALRGIYIGALMENKALTDEGVALASSLVDNYIKESGGATALLRKMDGKTYALDYIRCCVEGTYESIITEADDDENKDDEDTSEDNKIEDKSDDSSSDDTDEPEDKDDDSKDDEEKSSDDSAEEESPKDDDDEISDPSTTEEPEEKRQQMMDDLSQDEDINNAITMISKRCADAEEEFIKKNNEDKKAIEDIANKVSERIKGAEGDPSMSDEEAEEVKQEATRIGQFETNKLRERHTSNVYEQVVYNLTSSIVKDDVLRESYTEESGKLDMGYVMESAYCIYGLLETVNTLRLEKVDADYIQKALATM